MRNRRIESLKKIVLSIVFLVILPFRNFGQETVSVSTVQPYKHSIGAGVGFTTGYGLSYRFMPNKLGAQINFAPFRNSETERYSLGITFLYKLIESNITNLYLYQGNHFYYNSQLQTFYEPKDPLGSHVEPTTKRVTESYLNNGLGIGIEFIIAKRIAFNLMGGYAGYRNFQQINFTGETALYFRF